MTKRYKITFRFPGEPESIKPCVTEMVYSGKRELRKFLFDIKYQVLDIKLIKGVSDENYNKN